MTLNRSAEARQFLAAHPALEAVQLVITDMNGVGRGKTLARLPCCLSSLYATAPQPCWDEFPHGKQVCRHGFLGGRVALCGAFC